MNFNNLIKQLKKGGKINAIIFSCPKKDSYFISDSFLAVNNLALSVTQKSKLLAIFGAIPEEGEEIVIKHGEGEKSTEMTYTNRAIEKYLENSTSAFVEDTYLTYETKGVTVRVYYNKIQEKFEFLNVNNFDIFSDELKENKIYFDGHFFKVKSTYFQFVIGRVNKHLEPKFLQKGE